jgi:hypothetical protein
LVTAIENSPSQAFGGAHVLEFALSAPQAAAAQRFVLRTLAGGENATGESIDIPPVDIPPVADGPYVGSAYYDAVARYSALHTCNTWVAETMKSAGLQVHTHLVLFAGQTWHQARKISASAHAHTPDHDQPQSQGGGLPFWQTTVVVDPCGTTTVVFCGGGGLELLMQPANNPAARMALNKAFIL